VGENNINRVKRYYFHRTIDNNVFYNDITVLLIGIHKFYNKYNIKINTSVTVVVGITFLNRIRHAEDA